MKLSSFALARPLSLCAVSVLLAACASLPPEAPGPLRSEQLYALDNTMVLLRINASHPSRVLSRQPLQGLAAGEVLVGIDYRVARGTLYGLGRSGQLYLIDADSGKLSPVGEAPAVPALGSKRVGMDFNPAVDRIRIVADDGSNLRLHPDTGKQIDGNVAEEGVQGDKPLQYVAEDVAAGQRPAVTAVAYTYNLRDSKLTTLYGIDTARGTLVMQGSREGVQPFVSPDSGQLRTVGSLGLPQYDAWSLTPGGQGYGALQDAALDISDRRNAAFLAARQKLGATQLYELNLATGKASRLGRIADGAPLVGLAIIP